MFNNFFKITCMVSLFLLFEFEKSVSSQSCATLLMRLRQNFTFFTKLASHSHHKVLLRYSVEENHLSNVQDWVSVSSLYVWNDVHLVASFKWLYVQILNSFFQQQSITLIREMFLSGHLNICSQFLALYCQWLASHCQSMALRCPNHTLKRLLVRIGNKCCYMYIFNPFVSRLLL